VTCDCRIIESQSCTIITCFYLLAVLPLIRLPPTLVTGGRMFLVRNNQKRWLGHVLHHDSLVRTVLEGWLPGKEVRVRPKKMLPSWLHRQASSTSVILRLPVAEQRILNRRIQTLVFCHVSYFFWTFCWKPQHSVMCDAVNFVPFLL